MNVQPKGCDQDQQFTDPAASPTSVRTLGMDFSQLKLKLSQLVKCTCNDDSEVSLLCVDSCIIPPKDCNQLKNWLESVEKHEDPKLLYRASRDGWDAEDFHRMCNHKGATLSVIKSSGGYIFGGYLDQSWHSHNIPIVSEKAFLFSLHCHAGLPPDKFNIVKGHEKIAAYGSSTCGPIFGIGNDIHIASHANVNTESYTIGCSYDYPSGVATNTGSRNFQVLEMEVFHVS